MWDRIASLALVFCGAVLFYGIMRPGTETFLGRVFPSWLKVFLTSLFQALFLAVCLFGILGVFAHSGVNLIQHYPIAFAMIAAIGTGLFLWGNTGTSQFSSSM
jgi:hypothetical protein